MTRYSISLVNGDGIGPDLANSGRMLLESIGESCGIKFDIVEVEAGDNALVKYSKALPDFSFDSIKKSDVCLKAPVGEHAADVILVLRRYFELYANIRPAKSYPNVKSLHPSIDLVVVRENTEDIYLGWEFPIGEDAVIGLRLTTAEASRKIAEYAFEEALRRGRKKSVVCVHKSNVMRVGDTMFSRISKEISRKFPEVEFSESYVDACAMNLIRNPEQYDVILTTNLFGDILSDEAAQVVGGLGLAPAGNIGKLFAIFEPVHGAAFDIANKNIANPSSMFLSIKMMLEWLASKNKNNEENRLVEFGEKIENTLISLLKENQKTIDIGGNLHTEDFTKKFISKLIG
ncbi:MAG TPA: isocitrate/isopropylmalate dehydrogenase family protein [Nitrososphaeraceae archaeon]|nr:isocitrate/isopropylmalate dehydrogenase family protein [Nitrososphaeraceae archaeon]